MHNLEEESNKSCVPLQDIQYLDGLGFKLIPPKQGSKTPNIQSTNVIFNIPMHWAFDSSRSIRK